MPLQNRSKFGGYDFNRAVRTIRKNTDQINEAIGKINLVIGEALKIIEAKRNLPFMPTLSIHLNHVSSKLTAIQTASAEIRSAVELIAEISYSVLQESNNGD